MADLSVSKQNKAIAGTSGAANQQIAALNTSMQNKAIAGTPSSSSSYDNQYAMKITPANPNLRGLTTNYSNDGQNNLGGIGLGDLYELDYDRNKIESIFNQGTDAQYALMQKENKIAENQYANNQFANQQSAIETLRQQRNSQIASGMARGLNAAQEQGTILGAQQNAAAGALELANQRQLEADKIAAEYANNVVKALQEANSVKQAMAQVGAQLYEADMLGYTGELSAAAQMDANASDRYGYELGLQGTQYTADKGLEGTKYNADMNYKGTVYASDQNLAGTKYTADQNLAGTKYNADKNLEGTKYSADKNYEGTKYAADKNYDATINAASIQAAATRAAAAANGTSQNKLKTAAEHALDWAQANNPNPNDPNSIVNTAYNYMRANGFEDPDGSLWDSLDSTAVAGYGKDQTKKDWEKKTAKASATPTNTTYKKSTTNANVGDMVPSSYSTTGYTPYVGGSGIY